MSSPLVSRLRALPLPVVLLGIAALAMLVPAAQALTLGLRALAADFLASAALTGVLALLLALALAGWQPRRPAQSLLRGLVLGYLLLPPVLALPLLLALPGIDLEQAWFEMVACLTTTGATLLDPTPLAAPLHLWRGLVGWAGGFLVLVTAVGILAGLNLGGFELYAPHAAGREARLPPQAGGGRTPQDRLLAQVAALLPIYGGLTLALWLALTMAGDPALVGLMHAMAAISTSGISPLAEGVAGAPSGHLGEALLLFGLVLALSRRFTPGAMPPPAGRGLWHDPELRLGLALVGLVVAVIVIRQILGMFEGRVPTDPLLLLRRAWAALFTALSFLTTSGMVAADWTGQRHGSGMDAPGLMLTGLAIVGGGVGTAAGGVTLLRLWALLALVRHEMRRLALPASVGGGGATERQLRGEGATVAFVFMLLYALTLGAVHLLLSALGHGFEQALVLAVAAVSTTGPLAGGATEWGALAPLARSVLALTMVVGRLETLVLLALLAPAAWGARS